MIDLGYEPLGLSPSWVCMTGVVAVVIVLAMALGLITLAGLRKRLQ